jgi:hypothetical protein
MIYRVLNTDEYVNLSFCTDSSIFDLKIDVVYLPLSALETIA